jgi:hypothetical protein
MNATIAIRKGPRRAFVEAMVNFYVQYLGIENSRYNLYVTTKTGHRAHTGSHGMSAHDDKTIYIFLDSRLTIGRLMLTLAHEMVHAYQIAKGLLFYHELDGIEFILWRGKLMIDVDYYDRPWEKQAYARQVELVKALETGHQFSR